MHVEKYIPKKSIPKIREWIKELNVKIKVTKPRNTKLGDFKVLNGEMYISINRDLNIYSFLITLTHELAHAFIFLDYKFNVIPHGKEWKNKFKSMMLNFLNTSIFPNDLLILLSAHLINPPASTMTDVNLSYTLNKYNSTENTLLIDIDYGSIFTLVNGKKFIKGKKLRKRFKCEELFSNNIYLIHPLTKVKLTS